MAVEAKRACGFRKVGGLYMVTDGGGIECCRLPIPLTVCPCCGAGVKFSRAFTWVDPSKLMPPAPCRGVAHDWPLLPDDDPLRARIGCPASSPRLFGERAGLLWIGRNFYPTPGHYVHETRTMGLSRRVKFLPHGFKMGETWLLLAHVEACTNGQEKMPGVFLIVRPQRLERIVAQSQWDRSQPGGDGGSDEMQRQREGDEKRGITWVPVPDDDKDHRGSVHE